MGRFCVSGEKIEAEITDNTLVIKIPNVEFAYIIVRIQMQETVYATIEGINVSE